MARGTIYHITTDPDMLGSMSENDFYDNLDSLSVTYMEDRIDDDAKEDLDNLKEVLKASGFDIREKIPEDADEEEISEDMDRQLAFAIYAKDTDGLENAKMQYFSDRLRLLKRKLEMVSLKDFATNVSLACELSQYIDDDYKDMIYLDMGTGPRTHTMDHFLRDLEPGYVYYVSTNTVLMH